MRRRREDFNYWPSVADTILAAFMILLVLWFGQNVLAISQFKSGEAGVTIAGDEYDRLKKLVSRIPDLERDLGRLRQELEERTRQLAEAQARVLELEKQLAKVRTDKPPIISLAEPSGYTFEPGKAALSEDFASLLERSVFPQLREVLDRGDVNTIEIIGHTDGQVVRARQLSNLDEQLGRVLAGAQTVETLRFGSNAELGLMRAAAVRRKIEEWLRGEGLAESIQVRCYSAANSVPFTTDLTRPEVFSGEEDARRRIEIRFTQLPLPTRQSADLPR